MQNDKLLNNKVNVKMPGGTLTVQKEKSSYFFIGQPKKIYDGVFEGFWKLKNLYLLKINEFYSIFS